MNIRELELLFESQIGSLTLKTGLYKIDAIEHIACCFDAPANWLYRFYDDYVWDYERDTYIAVFNIKEQYAVKSRKLKAMMEHPDLPLFHEECVKSGTVIADFLDDLAKRLALTQQQINCIVPVKQHAIRLTGYTAKLGLLIHAASKELAWYEWHEKIPETYLNCPPSNSWKSRSVKSFVRFPYCNLGFT